MTQDNIDIIRTILLTAVLELDTVPTDLGILANTMDMKGGKMVIRTTNINTIDFVHNVMENHSTYKCLDLDSPGIKVRCMIPKPLISFLKKDQLLKLIFLHYPAWGNEDLTFFQPAKYMDNGNCLVFLNLSYAAQKTLAKSNWTIRLIGTNLPLTKHDALKGTAPVLESDLSDKDMVEGTSSIDISME